MNLDMIAEVWKILYNYLPNKIEQQSAADELISFLIDNNVSVEDIRHSFVGESLFLKVLNDYDKDQSLDSDEESDWDDDDDNQIW
jgi:hypothetical protein